MGSSMAKCEVIGHVCFLSQLFFECLYYSSVICFQFLRCHCFIQETCVFRRSKRCISTCKWEMSSSWAPETRNASRVDIFIAKRSSQNARLSVPHFIPMTRLMWWILCLLYLLKQPKWKTLWNKIPIQSDSQYSLIVLQTVWLTCTQRNLSVNYI